MGVNTKFTSGYVVNFVFTHTHPTTSRQKIYTMTEGIENYDDRGGVEDWEYVVWGEEVHAVLY